jgi:hypothetical protein
VGARSQFIVDISQQWADHVFAFMLKRLRYVKGTQMRKADSSHGGAHYETTCGDFMEALKYKGCLVEIYTARKEGQWTWAFTIDNGWAQANKGQGFETPSMAVADAATRACHIIDESGACRHSGPP